MKKLKHKIKSERFAISNSLVQFPQKLKMIMADHRTLPVFFVLMIALSLSILHAQNDANNVQVEDLRTPVSPGFVLLGVEPTSIERPTNPQDLAGVLNTAMINGKLSPNFALEISPAQFTKDRTVNSFLNKRSLGNTLWRNLSLSVATSTSDTVVFGKLDPGLGMGYGFRTMLFDGNFEKTKYWEIAKSLTENEFKSDIDEIIGSYEKSFSEFKKEMRKKLKSEPSLRENTTFRKILNRTIENRRKGVPIDSVKGFLNTSGRDNILRNFKENNTEITTEKTGFFWEVAGAGVTVFQNNSFQKGYFARFGLWTTLTYKFDLDTNTFEKHNFDVLLTMRYIWNDAKVDTSSYFDLGGRLIYERPAWNLSVESIGRYATDNTRAVDKSRWTWRLAALFEYKITSNLNVNISFGKNFDQNTFYFNTGNGLFGIAGLDISLGKYKLKDE
jgi:hypothetical protein